MPAGPADFLENLPGFTNVTKLADSLRRFQAPYHSQNVASAERINGSDTSPLWPTKQAISTSPEGVIPRYIDIPDSQTIKYAHFTNMPLSKLEAVLSPALAKVFGKEQTGAVPLSIQGTSQDPNVPDHQLQPPAAGGAAVPMADPGSLAS